jgi:glycosyltransferase involved in cell wall biosynthesis
MAVHQLLVGASPGDAVTNAALGLRSLLRRIGPSDVFANYMEPELEGDVLPLRDLAARRAQPGDVLVYHASIGEPDVAALLLERRERLMLVFHNIAPAAHFATVDPYLAARLAGGWVELAALAGRVDLALAVSAFNAAELAGVGYDGVEVWPLPLDPAAWLATEPDGPTAERLAREADRPLVLFVGQLHPHKRVDLLLSAFCVLQTYLTPEARLAVVGATRNVGYARGIEALARELNLDVTFTGRVTDAELAAWYGAASAFATMSEHEGIGIPMLEAMAHGVPVVARSWAAIPETLAGAGLLLPADAGPLLVAEALECVTSDEGSRKVLIDGGRERVAALDAEAAQVAFLRHLGALL